MTPRLQLLRRATAVYPRHQPYRPLAPFLYPGLPQQRSASILSSLSDTKGSYNKKIRVGRGPSSGRGKTSRRGHKGQKQHGKVPAGFNGGQTPDEVVNPPKGFENPFPANLCNLNLNRIQYWINSGRLDPSRPITLRELRASNCIHSARAGVKLLARGKDELTSPINIVVSRASAAAIASVEKCGGSVTTRYYTPFAIHKILRGQMDPIHSLQSKVKSAEGEGSGVGAEQAPAQLPARYRYRLPDPTGRKDLEYYRDVAHRGYLSHLVNEGDGPSLFWRPPGERRAGKKRGPANEEVTKKPAEEKLW